RNDAQDRHAVLVPDLVDLAARLVAYAAVGHHIGIGVVAGAPPDTLIVFADALGSRNLRAGGTDDAGTVAAAEGLVVEAGHREVDGAQAALLRIREVRQHTDRIHGARHFLVNVDASQLAKELEQVDHVEHVLDLTPRFHDLRSGDDERRPDTRLVGGALGLARLERLLHGRRQRTVVTHDHDDRIARRRLVHQLTVCATRGEARFHKQATGLGVGPSGLAMLAPATRTRGVATKRIAHRTGVARIQIAGRWLPRGVCRAVADRRHPGAILGTGLDPVDGRIGLDARPVAARTRISERHFFDVAVFDNDQRRNVIAVELCEIQRPRRRS